eukprot:gene5473-3946_t
MLRETFAWIDKSPVYAIRVSHQGLSFLLSVFIEFSNEMRRENNKSVGWVVKGMSTLK